MEPQRRHNLFLGEVTTHYDDAAIEFLIDVDWVSEEFN